MLENLIWKNVFLPRFIKKEIVSFYENHRDDSDVKRYSKKFNSNFVHYVCHKIHKNWLHNQLSKSSHLLKEIYIYLNSINLPMSFWLLLAKHNKVQKLQKLVEWGFDLKKVSSINHMEMNLIQQIIWAHHKNLLTFKETKEVLDILIKENISLFDVEYKISHYEKATSILKENKLSFDNNLIIQKRLLDNLYNWMNKDLYTYLMQSKLPESNKMLLDFVHLKNKVHSVYLENFSGNVRRLGEESLYKHVSEIEEIIKRQYIFKTQSAIYNSLSLLFNLPEFTDKLSHHLIFKCYDSFSNLKTSARKFLSSNLVNRNKEIVLLNLLANKNKINLNWRIRKEESCNILGLELIVNIDFVEHILANEKFKLNMVNSEGNNILHLIDSFALEQDNIRQKLKNKIEKLDDLHRLFLLNQYNENHLTPMLKAIEDENIKMIEFLLEMGVSGIEEMQGVDKNYSSPFNYMDNKLKNLEINAQNSLEEEKEKDWMMRMHKKWSIEKNYHDMKNKLSEKKKKEKIFKI